MPKTATNPEKTIKRRGLKNRWLLSSAVSVLLVIIIAGVFLLAVEGVYPGILQSFARRDNFAYICIFAVCAFISVTSALFVANYLFIRSIISPVLHLTEVSRRIAEGGYGIQALKNRQDEIGDLIDSLNELSTKIAQAERLQSEFISSVSHELRTPLTAITGWSETLLYDELITGDSRRGIMIISRESDRLTKMVGELLEFTRIQDGRFNLDIQKIDIGAVLDDSVLTYSEKLRQDEIEFIYNPYDDIFPEADADPERLKQVFLNLLDNAAKHGGEGKKIIVTSTLSGDFVEITFRDFGKGITAEDLPHIKEKFYKGASRERGSGIGLAVCDEIITRHSGTLEILNAKDGAGALATLRLPISK